MEHASLTERISREIVSGIRSQGLRPGDPIPTARKLAERFDVTVPTVREALRRLEATDIVRLRHGSGIYVGDAVDRSFFLNPYRAEGTLASALALAETRLVLEPAVAAEAARRRSPEALARLEGTLINAWGAPEAESPLSIFHVELAVATGNAVLAELIETLLAVRQRERRAIRAVYRDRERDHAEHLGIYRAVRDRDEAGAQALTAAHLINIRSHVRAAIDSGLATPAPVEGRTG